MTKTDPPNKGRLPKHKRKKEKLKTSDKPKVKKDVPKVPKKAPRDFNTDLREYLVEWKDRESSHSSWKFNKNLQTWALDNCFCKS